MTNVEYLTQWHLMIATIGFNFKAATYAKMPVQAKQLAREVSDAATEFAEAIEKGAPQSERDALNDRFMRAIGAASNYAQAKDADVLLGQVVVSIDAIRGFENAATAEGIIDERVD